MTFFNRLLRDREGATAIEYGLIAALIAVAAITAMQGLGTSLSTTFNTTAGELNNPGGEGDGAGAGAGAGG